MWLARSGSYNSQSFTGGMHSHHGTNQPLPPARGALNAAASGAEHGSCLTAPCQAGSKGKQHVQTGSQRRFGVAEGQEPLAGTRGSVHHEDESVIVPGSLSSSRLVQHHAGRRVVWMGHQLSGEWQACISHRLQSPTDPGNSCEKSRLEVTPRCGDPAPRGQVESQNHRMVGVGRDLCGSSSPTLLPKQGHLQQAVEDLVQAGLEYLQRRRLHSLSGQPVPVLCHPQREEVLPHVTHSSGTAACTSPDSQRPGFRQCKCHLGCLPRFQGV